MAGESCFCIHTILLDASEEDCILTVLQLCAVLCCAVLCCTVLLCALIAVATDNTIKSGSAGILLKQEAH